MNAFTRLCRNLGLMIHHVRHPQDEPVIRQTIRQQAEETIIAPDLVLRRTTIEEVEFKRPTSISESR